MAESDDLYASYIDWQQQILEEIASECKQNGPELLMDCKVIEFVSRSSGRNKPKRPPREVNFFKRNGKCYPIIRGEIRPRKNGGIAPDVMANEVLSYLDGNERTTDKLLALVKARRTR